MFREGKHYRKFNWKLKRKLEAIQKFTNTFKATKNINVKTPTFIFLNFNEKSIVLLLNFKYTNVIDMIEIFTF